MDQMGVDTPRWVAIFLSSFLIGCAVDDADISNCKKEGGCTSTIEVLKVSGNIPSSANDVFWSSANSPKKSIVDLGPQLITNPQWPNPSIKKVSLSAARNDSEIALFVEWQDDTQNSESSPGGEYTDQVAVMFPLKQGKGLPPVSMGGEGQPVNIWQWKAVWEKALAQNRNISSKKAENESTSGTPMVDKRVSSVEDLNAEGFSTLTRQEHQDVEGQGIWSNGMWHVVFKRALLDSDSNDIQFKQSLPMVIAVWDGGNRETNGQKGISDWVLLRFF